MDRIMVSGTIDMSSNLVGSTKKPWIYDSRLFYLLIFWGFFDRVNGLLALFALFCRVFGFHLFYFPFFDIVFYAVQRFIPFVNFFIVTFCCASDVHFL